MGAERPKYSFKGDTMIDKIKNFVKNVSSTTWILVAVGVLAVIVFTWANSHATEPVVVKPAVQAPAGK